MTLSENLIVGVKGCAKYFDGTLTERQIYHMVAQNQLPHTRKGKRLCFLRSELEAAFRSDAA